MKKFWILSFVFAASLALGVWGGFLEHVSKNREAAVISVVVTKGGETAENDKKDEVVYDKRDIILKFAGDIMLSRAVGRKMAAEKDFHLPFRKIMLEMSQADIAFGNLEGPISNRGKNQGSIYSFRADPASASGLKFASFDVLSLANNHILDWGREALLDTLAILKDFNIIGAVGAGANKEDANRSIIIEAKGKKFTFLGYTTLMPKSYEAGDGAAGISHFDLEEAKEKVKELKRENDFVIVSFHWGNEYEKKANDGQRRIARELIDAGADLIIGHHPHVVQELEQYGNGWIAYSLGNFVFDQNFSPETMEGGLLEVKISDGKISRVGLKKVLISDGFQPYLAGN